MLEKLGLTVDQVEDGKQALDAFIAHEDPSQEKYRALLLDLMMPVMR